MNTTTVSIRFVSEFSRLRIVSIAIIAILLTNVQSSFLSAQTIAAPTPLNIIEGAEAIIGGRSAEVLEQFDASLAGLPFPGDEIWFVDARESHNFPGDLQSLAVRRLINEHWEPSHYQDLLQSHQNDSSKVTLVYSHGDRTNEYYAIQRGLQFYRNIFKSEENQCCLEPAVSRPPIRLVIWAWKSEKAFNRPSRDFSVKSNRARITGTTLGAALNQFSDRNLLLVGYSLGGQSVLSALEDCQLINTPKPGKYQVCLIAPVMEGCFASQHRCCFPYKEMVGKAVIFDNSADRALKCSRILGFRTAPGGQASIQSLAFNGNLPLDNVSIIDLANSIGSQHSIVRYSADALVISTIRELVKAVEIESGTDQASKSFETTESQYSPNKQVPELKFEFK